jgi:hypothetical protein
VLAIVGGEVVGFACQNAHDVDGVADNVGWRFCPAGLLGIWFFFI